MKKRKSVGKVSQRNASDYFHFEGALGIKTSEFLQLDILFIILSTIFELLVLSHLPFTVSLFIFDKNMRPVRGRNIREH